MADSKGKACLIAGIQMDQLEQTLEATLKKYNLRLHSDHISVGRDNPESIPIFTSRWDENHRYLGVMVQEFSESARPLNMVEAESTLARVRSEGLEDANLYICVYRTWIVYIL